MRFVIEEIRRACARTLAALLLIGALPLSCATMDDAIEPPHVSLVNITPLQTTNLESTFRLDLRMVNPNDRAFRIRGLACKLDINGSTIAAGSADTVTELPQLGTAIIPVTVYSSMTDFMWLMFRMMSQSPEKREELKLTYNLRGTIFLDDALPGLDRLSFDTGGDLIRLRPAKRSES